MRVQTTVVLLGAMALAACNSSGGGGGVAGGPVGMATSNAAFEAARDAVANQGATNAMPRSYNGAFEGQVQAQLVSTSGTPDPLGHAVGDLSLQANWTDGQAGPAFTGTARNFEGEVQGTATSWDGELRASALPPLNTINRFPTCGGSAPGLPACGTNGTTADQRVGAVTLQMSGSLQAQGGTAGADSNLLLNGFVTDDLQSMTGGTGGTFILPDGTTAAVAGQDSTWYATRQ